MIKKIKKIKEIWKLYKTLRNNFEIFKVVEDIFKFVEKTQEEQKPMVCKIALINTKDGTKFSDFVSLWAGIGDANLVDRAAGLKEQNTELKRLLKLAIAGEMTNDDKKQVECFLKFFE